MVFYKTPGLVISPASARQLVSPSNALHHRILPRSLTLISGEQKRTAARVRCRKLEWNAYFGYAKRLANVIAENPWVAGFCSVTKPNSKRSSKIVPCVLRVFLLIDANVRRPASLVTLIGQFRQVLSIIVKWKRFGLELKRFD